MSRLSVISAMTLLLLVMLALQANAATVPFPFAAVAPRSAKNDPNLYQKDTDDTFCGCPLRYGPVCCTSDDGIKVYSTMNDCICKCGHGSVTHNGVCSTLLMTKVPILSIVRALPQRAFAAATAVRAVLHGVTAPVTPVAPFVRAAPFAPFAPFARAAPAALFAPASPFSRAAPAPLFERTAPAPLFERAAPAAPAPLFARAAPVAPMPTTMQEYMGEPSVMNQAVSISHQSSDVAPVMPENHVSARTRYDLAY